MLTFKEYLEEAAVDKKGHFSSTGGMTKAGVAAHRRANPGSKLQTAVTGSPKKGSKDAKRRKSYCARSAGQLKRLVTILTHEYVKPDEGRNANGKRNITLF